jgi:hypothetical protein
MRILLTGTTKRVLKEYPQQIETTQQMKKIEAIQPLLRKAK